jgi:acylphosphatase
VVAETGHAQAVADEITRLAARLNGTGTKGVPDNGRIEVLTELPANRVAEFKSALAIIGGVKSVGASEGISGDPGSNQKISLLMQINEAK